ncbi:hypothetical protein EGW08_000184 [Elysia chlorotica]|uniref:Endosome-associated-trafficking regulator 1 n=1 Tax=Elysia chlorotica TaxID=188477 RepID=A0A3S1A1H8_ELYCH|nr:hypothetical protein EGW08_000184 [Elysia chlorotica]
MAEKKDEEDNPFSFKTFVSVKEKKGPRSTKVLNSNFEDDIFSGDTGIDLDLNADGSNSISDHPKTNRHHENSISSTGATKNGAKKSRPKENPFSFKKFLSHSGGGASNDVHGSRVSSGASSATTASIGQASGSDPLSSVKDYTAPHLSDTSHLDLLGEHQNGSNPPGSNPLSNQRDDLFIDSDDEGAAGEDDMLGPRRDMTTSGHSAPSVLPDFLSDGAALSASTLGLSSMTNSTHEDLLSQIHMLQEENKRLKRDLAMEKQRCSDKNQRLSQLQIDLERQKKKEAEETKVMEKAVLQVEENLVTTTKRAVKAESAVAKQKQEIKALQIQVKTLTAENLSFQSHDGGLSDIRERTKYTAEQLQAASVVAEKNIKELSAGVDKLKLLSQVLSSLEKVTEVKAEASSEESYVL